MLTPPPDLTRRAFSVVLPLYGMSGLDARASENIDRIIQSQMVNLPRFDWKKLVEKMEAAEEIR